MALLIHSYCVIAEGGMASRPERRVEILYWKGAMLMSVCDLLILMVKLLPDLIKLAGLIIRAMKKQTPPLKQR